MTLQKKLTGDKRNAKAGGDVEMGANYYKKLRVLYAVSGLAASRIEASSPNVSVRDRLKAWLGFLCCWAPFRIRYYMLAFYMYM